MRIDVLFDSEHAVFFAGQTVSGRVMCHNSQTYKIRSIFFKLYIYYIFWSVDNFNYAGIKMKIKGSCNVDWSEREQAEDRRFLSSEDYFEQKFNLFSQGKYCFCDKLKICVHLIFKICYWFIPFIYSVGDEHELQSGEHSFPFSFLLPQELPSSFEGQSGSVRYYTKAVVDIPWGVDLECKKMFSIIGNVDLNRLGNASVRHLRQ